jgi:hypothetical protein
MIWLFGDFSEGGSATFGRQWAGLVASLWASVRVENMLVSQSSTWRPAMAMEWYCTKLISTILITLIVTWNNYEEKWKWGQKLPVKQLKYKSILMPSTIWKFIIRTEFNKWIEGDIADTNLDRHARPVDGQESAAWYWAHPNFSKVGALDFSSSGSQSVHLTPQDWILIGILVQRTGFVTYTRHGAHGRWNWIKQGKRGTCT